MTETIPTVPRRNRLDLFTPAERAIWDATQAVEALPPDPRLTEAVVLLGKARERVADFVDGIDKPSPEAEEMSRYMNSLPTTNEPPESTVDCTSRSFWRHACQPPSAAGYYETLPGNKKTWWDASRWFVTDNTSVTHWRPLPTGEAQKV